jgi:C4-dicarboxylate-specific signal transduction histidine kinase
LRQAQADLAHINRVTAMGELTASLAHEIKQPISAAFTDARTCLKWLARDEPRVEEARAAASRIIKDVTRASEIIGRIRSLFKKGETQRELADMNEVIREMVALCGTRLDDIQFWSIPNWPRICPISRWTVCNCSRSS